MCESGEKTESQALCAECMQRRRGSLECPAGIFFAVASDVVAMHEPLEIIEIVGQFTKPCRTMRYGFFQDLANFVECEVLVEVPCDFLIAKQLWFDRINYRSTPVKRDNFYPTWNMFTSFTHATSITKITPHGSDFIISWSDFTRSLEPVLRKNADKCKRAQLCARYAPPRKHFDYFSISPA